jgi:1-acyl-sn-glycerol-3-phosphate acyltransferase
MFRSILTIFILLVFTPLLGFFAISIGIFNPYSRPVDWIKKIWADIILWGAGVKISVSGFENVKPGQSYIFMINHQSLFDILAAIKILPYSARFIAKKELFKIPMFGWILSAIGMIKIDRSNREQAIVSMNRALNAIKGGISVIIFPEGTRSKDGLIHDFKKGGFVIAIKGDIPVVPVAIYGTRDILQKHSLRLKAGPIFIKLEKPVETENYNYQTRDQLVEKVHRTISNAFDKLKNTHG